ncbi:MAG: GNAT family N-acetyltransferase [Bacillota bacterium]
MIRFERVEDEDVSILKDIQMAAFEEDVVKYGSGPMGYNRVDWHTSLIENKEYYFKILSENKIVGGVVVFDKGEGHYHLGRIFIDKDYQNRGIGEKAIRFLENEFKDAKKWTLDTPYLSFRNHHFYEKMGYIKVGETVPDKESGFYLFLYEKHIG